MEPRNSVDMWLWTIFLFGGAAVLSMIWRNFMHLFDRKRQVTIVRRNSVDLDENIREYIKDNCDGVRYRIMSTNTYPEKNEAKNYELMFNRFIEKIFKTNDDLYIMTPNLETWEYNNYVDLCKNIGVSYKIVQFENAKYNSEIINDPRTSKIIKLQ